tara:strand:- start:4501 stop:6492 length:1992 start_codon:yes stop_codon:yes gene_type:complete
MDNAGNLCCTWDNAFLVAKLLGVAVEPETPIHTPVALPGLEEYKALGLDKVLRDYQKEAVRWLVRRTYGIDGDPMRSGKTLSLLAASIALGAKRVLVIAPALAKWVWADEIRKWIGQDALILEGRAGTTCRKVCKECWGSGLDNDNKSCTGCKSKSGASLGCIIYKDNDYSEEPCWTAKPRSAVAPLSRAKTQWTVYEALVAEGERLGIDALVASPALSGWSAGKIKRALTGLEKRGYITRDVIRHDRPGVAEAIESSRWIIVNYDILTGQVDADPLGRTFKRDDLPGWAGILSKHKFDVAIGDESHLLRGRPTNRKRRGLSRRERFCAAVRGIPRVWLATGTPIYGRVRDLWGQLDACSGGLWGDKWYPFDIAYCEGQNDGFGWRADGRSARADNELRRRLLGDGTPEQAPLLLKRPRSMILAQMPPKVRQIIRIDGVPDTKVKPLLDKESAANAFDLTFEAKLDTVCENLLSEMAEGGKCIAFVFHRRHVEALVEELKKRMASITQRVAMKAQNAWVWAVHGGQSSEARFKMAKAYVEHPGGACFISTTDAVQVAVSLRGAQSVHFVDLHWNPAALFQAEDRPYEPGTTGLTIIYYIVRQSVDEHVEHVVLPKIRDMDKVTNEEQAREALAAMSRREQEKDLSLQEIAARIASVCGDEDGE